ncbi:MAG: TPM domain-containing protein [Bacteroidales bacterium]
MKTTRQSIIFFLSSVLFFLSFQSLIAQIDAKSIENPKIKGLTNWVNNQDNILSMQTVQLLNENINRLYDSTSCQISVVVIEGDKQTSARDLSMELFDLWQPGGKDKNNGMIILVVTQARQCFFRTGYGLEHIITDAKSTKIFSQIMKPYFIEGKWDEGVTQGTMEIINQLYKQYDNYSNITGKEYDSKSLIKKLLIGYFFIGCIVFILITRLQKLSIKDIEYTFRSKRVNRYKKVFRNYVGIIATLSIFTLPIFVIMYKWRLYMIRNEKVFCTCGNEMRLLSEKNEDEFLNHSQQLEESLKSRDYDVWLCPKCGRIAVYCYEKNSYYENCPICHAKTYAKISEQIIHTGVLKQKNIVRKTYYCKNCHHKDNIDEKVDNSLSLIGGIMAGNIMGSMDSVKDYGQHRGFKNFSGGSFGGGFSGGGGGGGSW